MRKRIKSHCLVYGYLEPSKSGSVARMGGGSNRRNNRSKGTRAPRANQLPLTTDGEMDMGDEESENDRMTAGA